MGYTFKTPVKPMLGKKNVLTSKEFRPVIYRTIDELVQILTHSYGRTARFSMVLTPETGEFLSDRQVTATTNRLQVYSKDGAQLTQSIQYANSIQTYIQSILVYIGQRVDSACGDGTTTSMLYAGLFLKYLLKNLDECNVWSKFSTVEVINVYDELVTELEDILSNQFKITIQDLMDDFGLTEQDAMSTLAYIQAYTSSNGDVEIAEAMAEAFYHIPLEGSEELYQVSPSMELEKKIEVIKDDAQFTSTDVVLLTRELMSFELSKGYVVDNAKVICLMYELVDVSAATTEVFKYIETLKADEPLVIFAPKISSSVTERIVAMNTAKEKHVCLFAHGGKRARFSKVPVDTYALCGLLNVKLFDIKDEEIGSDVIEDCIRPGVRVEADGRSVKLFNLYEPIPGYAGHPGIRHPEEYPVYARVRKDLHEVKTKTLGHHHSDKNEAELIAITLSSLEHVKRIKIVGGGRTFEQLAIRLVIEDCIAASLSGINHGMYFNGPNKLQDSLITMRHVVEMARTNSRSPRLLLKEFILTCMLRAAEDLVEPLGTSNHSSHDWAKHSKYIYVDSKLNSARNFYNTASDGDILKKINKLKLVPPTQPAKMFTELFARIRETVLNVALSEHIVTIGEVTDLSDVDNDN